MRNDGELQPAPMQIAELPGTERHRGRHQGPSHADIRHPCRPRPLVIHIELEGLNRQVGLCPADWIRSCIIWTRVGRPDSRFVEGIIGPGEEHVVARESLEPGAHVDVAVDVAGDLIDQTGLVPVLLRSGRELNDALGE